MTLAYRGASSRVSGSTATLSLTQDVPSLADGDLMLLALYGNASESTPPQPPAGWTPVVGELVSSTYLQIWSKIASSEPGSYTIDRNTGAKTYAAGIIAFYSTTATPLVVDASAHQSNTSSTNRTFPGVTTTQASAGLACFLSSTGGTSTPPGDMTERWDELLSSAIRVYAMTSILTSAGATGDKVATGAASTSRTVTVAVVEYIAPVPDAPSDLDATGFSPSQINLSWTDESSDEDGFRIERSDDGTTGWTEVGDVAAGVISFSDTGLDAGTEYFYRVFAYNGDGDSAASNVASAETLPEFTGPTGLTASAGAPLTIDLEWVDTTDYESGYEVERSLTGVGGWAVIATLGIGVESYTDTGLTAGQEYFYRVRAYQS